MIANGYLKLFDLANRLCDVHGLRPITIAIRTETWSADIGTPGAVISSVVDTPVTPAPEVVKLSDEASAFISALYPAALTGNGTNPLFRIGPIVRTYSAGGYTVAQLFGGSASAKVRGLILLGDGDEIPFGTRHKVVRAEGTGDPFATTLVVARAQDL